MKRRIGLIFLLIAIVVLFTGCSMQPQPMDTLKDGNFFFSTFVYPLAVLLDWFHNYLGSYGLAILALTIIIRLIILPLAIKQYKSMKGMQKIQPQMKELREKHKDDPQLMQAETLKLMQEHNVNPAAGCLPLLIQMPVLFALYYAINTVEVVGGKINGEAIAGETFLWFHLGKPDPFYILAILAAVTTILPMLFSMNQQPNNPQMKILMLFMPVMVFFFSWTLPAALPLYWVYSNLFSTVQSYFLYREKPSTNSVTIDSNQSGQPISIKKEKKKKRRRR